MRAIRLLTAVVLPYVAGCSDATVPLPDAALPNEVSLAKGPSGSGNVQQVSLPFTLATDINQNGSVVGYLYTRDRRTRTSTRTPTLWIPSVPRGTTGSLVKLAGPGEATGISDVGQVIYTFSPQGSFLWDGTTHGLGTPAGSANSYVLGISPLLSDGSRLVLGGGSDAAAWRVRGSGSAFEVTSIDNLPGPCCAYAANGSGVVVGDGPRAWTFTGTSWLGTPLPLLPGSSSGSGLDVNAAGSAVGAISIPTSRPVVWKTLTDLPVVLPLSTGGPPALGAAWGMNDAGMIVGDAGTETSGFLPYLWVPSGPDYTVIPLGCCTARDVTEPYTEGTASYVNVVGGSAGKALLRKVRLP